MSKWRLLNKNEENTIINAACRYLNVAKYPNIEELAAIIGIEEIPEKEDANEAV